MKNTPLKKKTPLKRKTILKSSGTTPKKVKPKLKSVAQLKKEADKWWSLATRYRFAEKLPNGEWWAACITCHTRKPVKLLQCGHFMSRRHNILRYSDENTAPQCYGCNVMQQGRQYQFGIEIDGMYGTGTAQRLHDESKELHQFTREELLEIIHDAKEEVSYYESR